MPTYGGATSNFKVTVSHECARSPLGLQAHCPESALASLLAHSPVIPLKLSRTN
jgi:hypothetical protein